MARRATAAVPDRGRGDGGSRRCRRWRSRTRCGARGVHVTFAGSPDRVEARLVPEAGYELDTFRVSGLPRRPSLALVARGSARAAVRRVACARILERRRPDVVLGGGGYVAGPMVLAALAAADPGRADARPTRTSASPTGWPRRSRERVFLAYPIAGPRGPKYRVVGRPIPATSRAVPREDARARSSGSPPTGRVLLVFGGAQGARALNEARGRRLRPTRGPAGPAPLRRARLSSRCGRASRAPDYRPAARARTTSAPRSRRCDLALARAGGSVWELAAAGHARGPRPVPVRDRRPPDEERALLRARRRRGRRPGDGARPRRRSSARAARRRPSGSSEMGEAMLALAKPDAADVIAEELIALAAA